MKQQYSHLEWVLYKLQLRTFLKGLWLTILLAAMPIAYAVDLPPETYYQATDSGLDDDDASSGALPIGFTFNFFGNDYTELYTSSNGYLTFSSDNQTDWSNDNIPSNTTPDNYIAPFWDDLTVLSSDKAKVYYKTIGTAPNHKMVVQFTNVYFYATNLPVGTFQVILYNPYNDNVHLLEFIYQPIVPDPKHNSVEI